MAIWKLIETHYLMVPEHYWEQQETDRDTGRRKIKKYPVPTHLNPKDPSDYTHKTGVDIRLGGNTFADGDIVVAWAQGYKYVREKDGMVFIAKAPVVNPSDDKPDPRILIFEGPPTPGMEALDAEAKEIMKSFTWEDPMKDKYFGMTYAERLVFDSVTKPPEENKALEAMGELMKQMAEIQAQNTQLLAQVLQREARRL